MMDQVVEQGAQTTPMAAREVFSGLMGMDEELRETGLSRIIGFIGLKNISWAVASVAAITLCTSAAYADDQFGECPKIWSEYVDLVAETIKPLGDNFPMVFVSRDGDIYDCLNRIHDDALLEKWSISERSMPVDRTSLLSSDSNSWPQNICNKGSIFENGVYIYHAIYLPLQVNIIANQLCKKRIVSSLANLMQEFGNE